MSFSFDERTTREPLGSNPLRKRRLLEALTQSVSSVLSASTASNYFTEKYGSNHRVIYEGVAKIISQIILEVVELGDDSSYLDLRTEFVLTRLTSLLYDQDLIPNASSDRELLEILLNTLDALLSGSTELSIQQVLASLNQAGEIEILQTGEHSVSILSAVYSITSVSEGHRHFVLNDGKGLTSTKAPLSYVWGDDLHQHDIIDGVVQEYTDSNGVSHTHEMEFGVPTELFKLQENLSKVFETTKPAHVLADNISSVLGESISAPSESSVVDVDNPSVVLDSDTLIFSLGSAYQENMRKARVGTFESLVYGYTEGAEIRLSDARISVSDKIAIEGLQRTIISVEEIDATSISGAVSWSAPRFNTSGTGVISNGYFTADAGNSTLQYLGEGELILIEGSAFFVERRAPEIIFPRATKVLLNNTTDLLADLYEVSLLDYQWTSRIWSYRTIEMIAPTTSDTQVLRFPVRKTYKGLPVTSQDLISLEGHTILEYRALTNEVVLDAVINRGDTISFRVPYGEGDKFNFLSLNNPSFTLNAYRVRGQAENLSGRNRSSLFISQGGERYGDNPVAHLYSSKSVTPKTIETRSVKVVSKGENTLNNVNHVLGRGFVLNSFTKPLSSPNDRVIDFATASARVYNGRISSAHLGFIAQDIISVVVDGVEVDYTYSNNVVLVDVPDDTLATVTAISAIPLNAEQEWVKSSEVLSEGQVSFVNERDNDPLRAEETPNDIMSNPFGLKINGDDQLRTKITSSTRASFGTSGEEVFYEDNPLSYEISGTSYTQYIPISTAEPSRLGGGLVLNSSSSLLGRGPVLALSLGSSFRFDLFSPRSQEDIVPQIQEEVTTSVLIESDSADSVPAISEVVETAYTMLSSSQTDIVPLVAEQIATSLLLVPSTTEESIPLISEDLTTSLSLIPVQVSDTVPLASDLFSIVQTVDIAEVVPALGEESDLLIEFSVGMGDTIPFITETTSTSLILEGADISESVPAISDDVISGRLVNISDIVPLVQESTSEGLSLAPITVSDVVSVISEENTVFVEFASSLTDTIPSIGDATSYTQNVSAEETLSISEGVTTSLLLSPAQISEGIPALGELVSTNLTLLASESVPALTEDLTTSYTNEGVSESDTIPDISDLVETELSLLAVSESDNVPAISDDTTSSILLISEPTDNVPSITESVNTTSTLLISDTLPSLTEATTEDLTIEPSSVSDIVPSLSETVSISISNTASISDTVPSISEGTTESYSYTGVSESDTVPTITEASTADFALDSFDLYAAITNNAYTTSDSERIFIHTKGDYFATGGYGEETLFSSWPTPSFYADSDGDSALGLDPASNRRGFIKTLIQTPAYDNTTPPSANVSWRVQNDSITAGEWAPDTDYEVFVRTGSDDAETEADVEMAFETSAVGANSQTVMGASPSYSSLFPQGDSTARYYKHSLRVDRYGNVSFTQDTVAKTAPFNLGSSVRVFFFFVNNDFGLGASATVNSSVHITSSFGNTVSPTIHDANVVTSVSGVATVDKSTTLNTDNNAQFSYRLTVGSLYRITLDRDTTVDFDLFIQTYSDANSGSEWNTLYTSSDTLNYKGFDTTKAGNNYYLQILDDGNVVIHN